MSEPLLVRVSRDGKEIGTYSSQEAIRLFLEGVLKLTDFYWHDGMTDWAPLVQLQALEERRQSAERALIKKQEEAKNVERLAQERAKAKEEEDRAAVEATRLRLKQEWSNRFICHSCRKTFSEPKRHGEALGCGFALILGSGIILLFTYNVAADSYRLSISGISFGAWLATVSFFLGLSLFTASQLRSPCCPECDSTNFARAEDPKD